MHSWYRWILQYPTEVFPPRSKWRIEDIPDLEGRVVIVTGGNTGIGRVTIKYLLRANARVYMASRDPVKSLQAISELKTETGKEDLYFLQLDLGDLECVKRAAAEFAQKEKHLHLLFNNAGLMLVPMDQLTKDGFDLQFGVNALGPAYLTLLLMPLLLETAQASEPGSVRVINSSSMVHLYAPSAGIDYRTLRAGPMRNKLSSWTAYAQSKWANVVFARELARRYSEKGVVSCVVHPGIVRTELLRHSSAFRRILHCFMFRPDSEGALTQLYAGTSPQAADAHGQYFIPLARRGVSRPDTYDVEAGKTFWTWVESVTAHV
ncbi:NADP-binding protein [Dacryopinax primogenitus]|uniref:NADP-binding protein n=1 Tax=Dacryopinax primogenitus (strain DJM 731) TaxID=1858805 RepID=M5FS35_DACPD|nr:NADP-binding protein [Dacryopinax primogenitus]EJU00121.1 NADP-binding protein [Dacryopinax primogenitus]